MEKYSKKTGEGFYIRPYERIEDLFITRQLYLGIHDNISNYQEVSEEEGQSLLTQRASRISEILAEMELNRQQEELAEEAQEKIELL